MTRVYHYITEIYMSSGRRRAYYETASAPLKLIEYGQRMDTYRTLYCSKAKALAALPKIVRLVRNA